MADIKRNLVYLSENITNLPKILVHLIQGEIISDIEREHIRMKKSSTERNEELLTLMGRKDWKNNRTLFLEILRKTNNEHCANKIENGSKWVTEEKLKTGVAKRRRPLLGDVNVNNSDDFSNEKHCKAVENVPAAERLRPHSTTVLSIILVISAMFILFQYSKNNVSSTSGGPVLVAQDKTIPIIYGKNIPIKQDNTIALKQENTVQQPIWFEVTAPNRFYVGREKETALLEKYWNTSLTQKTFSIIAVTGLGGVGKSELAKNFAKWFYENVEGHCIWINAESNYSVEESFRKLAENNLKISQEDHFGRKRIFLEIVEEVYEKLFGEKVLFVFDNVENYELPVLELLIHLSFRQPPTILKPFVITTSRLSEANQYIGTDCNVLDLKVLTKEYAKQFFYNSLSVNEPPEDIKELIDKLCERLQFYPLAMQQAAAYIKEKLNFSGLVHEVIKNYLDQMEIILKKLLNHKLPKYEASFSNTTYLTWKITFDKLREESGGVAVDIMNIISFLSPDDIPTQMVSKILQKTGKVVSDIASIDKFFELIRKYSMINFLGEKSISVHRLVQEVTRIELKELEEFHTLLNEISEIMGDVFEEEKISLKELIHVQMVWQHFKVDKEIVRKPVSLPSWISNKLMNFGKYRDMLDFATDEGNFLEIYLGQNCRWTLIMKFWKGVALAELGEYTEAFEILENVYEKQKGTIGEEHIDFLRTATAIGTVYLGLGKFEEAMEIYKLIIEKNERIYGKENLTELIGVKNNMALALVGQKKYADGIKLYEAALEVSEGLYGVEDHNTLNIKCNIAKVKLKQKNYGEALKEFQEVLEIEEKVLEWNHPSILNTKHSIAEAHYRLGRHKESLQMFTEVQEHEVQIFGPRHSNTVNTEDWINKVEIHITLLASLTTELSSNFSGLAKGMMYALEVENFCSKKLADFQMFWVHLRRDKQLTEKHGYLLGKTYEILYNSGKYQDILEISNQYGQLLESALGDISMWALKLKYWKGRVLMKFGEYMQSLEILEDVYEKQKRNFGEDHDDSMITATELGRLYLMLKKYEMAKKMHSNVFRQLALIYGTEYRATLAARHNIAQVLDVQKQYDKALKMYMEILEVEERLFGIEDPDTLTIKNNIANVKVNQKSYGEALKEFQEILEVREKVLELNHPGILRTKYYIAETYYYLGRHDDSLQMFKEVHKQRVETLGPGNSDTIDTSEWIERVKIHIVLLVTLTRELSSTFSGLAKGMMYVLQREVFSLEDLSSFKIFWLHLKKDNQLTEKDGLLLGKIYEMLYLSGKYQYVLDISSEYGEFLEYAFGETSRWALRMQYWEGLAVRELGKLWESLEILTDVYEMQKRNFGEEHDDSLTTYTEIGRVYKMLNKYETSTQIYNSVLEKYQRIYGPEHPDTLSVRHNIANVLDVQMKFNEALMVYEEVLQVHKRLFEPDNPGILSIRHNIAVVKLNQRNFEEALKEFQEVLEIRERVLELNHPETLNTKFSIALTFYQLGRNKESLQLLKDVHKKRVEILGPRHPESINTNKMILKMEMGSGDH